MDVALTADDYQVTVNHLPCPVVLLTSTSLSCRIDASVYVGVYRAVVKVLHCCIVLLKQFLSFFARFFLFLL